MTISKLGEAVEPTRKVKFGPLARQTRAAPRSRSSPRFWAQPLPSIQSKNRENATPISEARWRSPRNVETVSTPLTGAPRNVVRRGKRCRGSAKTRHPRPTHPGRRHERGKDGRDSAFRRFGVSGPESVHLEAHRGLRELDKPSPRGVAFRDNDLISWLTSDGVGYCDGLSPVQAVFSASAN